MSQLHHIPANRNKAADYPTPQCSQNLRHFVTPLQLLICIDINQHMTSFTRLRNSQLDH